MKIIQATAFSLDSFAPATATKPAPGAGEILVKVSAATLNYRDRAALQQMQRAAQVGKIVIDVAGQG